MIYYIIPVACFIACYLLGVAVGRKSIKIDMERGNNGRVRR